MTQNGAMPICEIHRHSAVLGKQVALYVLLPEPDVPPPFATMYLLHGLSDDYTGWMRRTRIEPYVIDAKLPLVVVMPDGFRGFYTDANDGTRYAIYCGPELVQFVETTFPVKRSREARCIGGLSMGGYGALRLGLGFPELYCSVVSHSGAFHRGCEPCADDEIYPEQSRIFGTDPRGTNHDLLKLARDVKATEKQPKIRIDCGTEDHLIDANRTLHRKFDELGIEHEYEEFPGAHDWAYWDLHVRDALKFHIRNMRLAEK
jgi:S-formylglutathione hydrolase FrmB